MKLHLPIGLRKALMAVFAALAVSPAMAHEYYNSGEVATKGGEHAVQDSNMEYYDRAWISGYLNPQYKYYLWDSLEMTGSASNKIVSAAGSAGFRIPFADDIEYSIPGYLVGSSNPNVTVDGHVTMKTTNGYNAIVGSVVGPVYLDLGIPYLHGWGGRPNVEALNGNILMDGPANAVMLGSSITGSNIKLENSDNQTISVGKVVNGIMPELAGSFMPADLGKIEGIFNIVQGSNLTASGSVTMNTATDTAVNNLKVNVITGGRGDLTDIVQGALTTILGEGNHETVAKFINGMADDDFGSTITAGTDITMGGGASVIIDTTLSDLVEFKDQKDFAALLAGNEANSTEDKHMAVKLEAGKDLNLNSIVNMVYGTQNGDGVELKAGTATAEDVVGAIKATGAFNIIGGKTTLEADAINLTPNKAVSVNQLIGELDQLGSLLSIDKETLTGITKNLGDLADHPISANVIAGGANLTSKDVDDEGNGITIGGTLGLVMNTPVDKVVGSLMSLTSGSEEPNMTQLGNIAKDLLKAGKATSLTSEKGNINVGSQFNLVHGGNFTLKEGTDEIDKIDRGKNSLVLNAKAGNINVEGTANVVSGNVVVNAGSRDAENKHEGHITMTGKVLSDKDMAKAVNGLVDSLVDGMKNIPGVDKLTSTGILDKLVNKGSVNMVTGGAMLDATGNITMTGKSVDDKEKIGNINAVIDTEITDVVDAVIGGGTGSLVQGSNLMTTLKADGNINMLGRVNVVNGKYVTLDAGKEVNMQGNISMIGGAKVTADSISINTSTEDKYKMYLDAKELGALTGETKAADSSAESPLASIGVNGAIIAGGANVTAKGKDGIEIGGTAGIYVNTELTDVMDALGTLQAGHEMLFAKEVLASGIATTVTATTGSIKLGSQYNVLFGGGDEDKNALTFTAKNGAILADGALNVMGGNTTLTANNINLTPAENATASINQIVGQLGGLLPFDFSTITGKLGDLANQNVNASIVAGGAQLKAEALTNVAEGQDAGGDIVLGGTAGIVVNTKVTDVLDALGHLQNGHELLFAKSLLESGTATSLEASRDINMGAQLNVLHGGGFTKTEGENTLTITAGNDVKLHGAANLVSGNVVVKAGSVDDEGNIEVGNIHMHGEILDGKLAEAVKGFVDYQFEQRDIPGEGKLQSSGIIDKLVDKGSFNVVTGGATLEATGNIKLDSELDTEFKQASAINAVLDTQFTDVITAAINGEPSAILPTDKDVFKPTTTLTAGGDIDMLGRVNVVAGLRGNVVVDANGDVNLQGNISMVAGNASVTGETININTVEDDTYKMHLNAQEVKGLLGVSDDIANAIQNMGMMNAAVVAGGANLTSTGKDKDGNGITIGGTVGLLMNTSVADAIKELNPLNPGKNPSEFEIAKSLLQKGEATTLTAKEGNILVGSQFNLVHGGGFPTTTEAENTNILTLTANKGNINVEGTANVVSGNVVLNAGSRDAEGNITHGGNITMTGEVLSDGMAEAANGLVDGMKNIPGVDKLTSTGILDKLVNKGSVNMVTGGAMLDATGDITMTGKSVDDKEKIGNINAVIDTELVDVLEAKDGNFASLVHGGGHMTTLQADGNINLEGRVNVVNGKYVTLDAGKDVNLQGNLSMIGGATVNADGSININTSTEDKYKMYIDSAELSILPGGITLPDGLDDVVENTGVNAAVIAGGAKLEADGDITTGGTAGILVNTPMAEVGDRVMSLLTNPKHDDETWMVYELLQKGIATTVTSTNGNIVLGSQLNVLHGGNMDNADAALKLSAANGAIKLNGTLNMVSGNVTMDAESINMTGEALKYDLGDRLAGMPGAEVLNKLNTYGSANVVLGGATLTATGEEGITMKGLANAVLDVELVDGVEAFMNRPDMSALIDGGAYETKLHAKTGDINLLGRFNVVNGGKVSLLADKGDVNVNGGVSFIGGGATVTANNIKLNDDETGKYQMYFDSEELGAILPAGSPITEMLNTFGITDLLGTTGVNGAIVAGGANLTATGNITTGGTVSLLVNTPLSEVMKELEIYAQSPNKDETWMVYQLLQKGTATTVQADGNINLASRLNLLHGGNMGNANAALKLTAGNDIKMSGSANVVSGNVTMNADSINMKGEPLKFDMGDALDGVPGAEMLGKLAAKGSANIVTGGATLTATNNIKLDSMANFVLDTQATNVLEAFMEQDISFLVQGGNKLTSLNAGGNIDLTGRLNVVNGAYVALNADKDVNINGTLNMVSGKAKVNGANINLNGQNSVGLNWGEIIPGDVGNYMDQMGVTDKLNKGVNGNLVLGGSTLTATNDIKLSGMASVVTNVPLGSAFEALNKKMDETWQPELWLMKEMINDGIATTLTAENGNIEMTSRLNMLHGGNFSADGANALSLTAGKEVIIAGTANIISGNTQVTAGEGIKITGKTGVGFDWNQIADALPDKYDGYGKLAGEMGILDKLSKGVNGSVIAGGATLTATNGDITMEGMATAVVDVTAKNVLEAVETMNGTPIMEGGAEDTTITAVNGSINLNSRLNLVNGGQVTVNAGQNVNMGGTFNVVSGNATVNADSNIEMNAQNKVGVDITPMLKGHYAEIAKEMGMADVLENGVSSNIVAGGANLDAKGDVVMDGVATAIVDTTASNVIGAVKGNDLGELMKGGRSTTEVTAGNDIVLKSQMNVVNGGNTKNVSGVVLNAGRDVIMSGDIDVVNRATVRAGNEVAFNGDKSVVKYSNINADKVSFTGKNAEITDVNFNTASVEVIGTALVNTADSEVAISSLNVEIGNIENLGSLELETVALAGATLHNAGSIEVNGAMTLNSATLSFVADSNNVANGGNLTFNSTAITLGADGSIPGISTRSGNGTENMIVGVSFLLHYDGIEFIDNTNEFEYNLAIFQGATEGEYEMLKAAIAQNELTLTLDNGFHIESINSMEVKFSESDGVVYLNGTATVPEPTTATLSLLALAALAARRRRQK